MITETSKGATGYVKFGNGFLMQWGDGSSGTIQFPKPFSNTNYKIVAIRTSTAGYEGVPFVTSKTTSSCLLRGVWVGGGIPWIQFSWVALGY